MSLLLSFLIPVRDAATRLGAAIDSALAQEQASIDFEFEVIVVDDGSRDASLEVAMGARGRDTRVRVLAPERLGLVAGLTRGLGACRGDFIARLDADDRALPQRLARQLERFARDPSLGVVDGRVRFVGDAKQQVPEGMRRYEAWVNSIVEPDDFARLRFYECAVVHPAVTMRRELFAKVGAYRDVGPEDFDLWLRMHEACVRFAKVDEVLVEMTDHGARLTRSSPRYTRRAFREVAMIHLEARCLAARRIVLWGAGKGGRPWLRWLRSIGRTPVAILDIDPLKIGAMRGGDVVVRDYRDLARIDGDFMLVALGVHGADDAVRVAVSELRPEWREGLDYFFVVT